jgi:hypothetical protein
MFVALFLLVVVVVIVLLLALIRWLLVPAPEMLELPVADPGAEPEAGAPDEAEGASDALVAVARFHFPEQANMLRGRLLADGIPAFVTNEHSTQAFGYLRLAHGGVRVLVPAARVEAARAVIAALDAGEYALDENVDDVDPGRESSP